MAGRRGGGGRKSGGRRGGGGHGKSIKLPKVYEDLRLERGMSKSKAAAISNAMWHRKRGKG